MLLFSDQSKTDVLWCPDAELQVKIMRRQKQALGSICHIWGCRGQSMCPMCAYACPHCPCQTPPR